MGGRMSIRLEEISPEQAGIPSEAILSYVRSLEENGVNLHGFLMMRGKNIVAEAYYQPFHKDYVHRMYSVSKSFTSLAIGYLIDEGKLHLDDHICDYFKDKLENNVHPYIQAIRIKDMLKMATAHQTTTYKRYDGDWVKSFFVLKPSHIPGTVFSYDTSSSHVLAALVERLSGKSLLDYLREKLLNALEFSKNARWLKDPAGVSQGGTGLLCTMRDLAKVAYVCMNEGVLDGEQLIPKEYLKEATKKQINTNTSQVPDERNGYGYQFWKTRTDGFAFFGMGGQVALCYPKHDFVYVTTADTQGSQVAMHMIYEAFNQNIYPYLEKYTGPLPENKQVELQLKDKLQSLKITAVVGEQFTATAGEIANKTFIMDENSMGITQLKIQLNDNKGILTFTNQASEYEIPFGFGGFETIHDKDSEFDIMTSGAFVSENELHIISYLMGDCFANIKAVISFRDNYVTINSKKAAEGMLNEFEGFACGHYNK